MIGQALGNELGIEIIFICGGKLVHSSYEQVTQRFSDAFVRRSDSPPVVILIDEVNQIAADINSNIKHRLGRRIRDMASGKMFLVAVTSCPSMDFDDKFRQVFDTRELTIGIPDMDGRLDILQAITETHKLEDDVDLAQVAKDTKGYTHKDLQALFSTAAINDIERGGTSKQSFTDARSECKPSALGFLAAEIPTETWDDIGGQEELKKQMNDLIVLPMRKPEAFLHLGCRRNQSFILYGPTGCGKTHFVKALANMSGASFISVRGPQLIDQYVGNTEKNIREVFATASQAVPCIIFFDEIDSIGHTRDKDNKDSNASVHQMLTEMDGIMSLQGVTVIGATNRLDAIDEALQRPGRFDRAFYIGLPDEKAREAILHAALRTTPKMGNFDEVLKDIAQKTRG